jgi:hypothetical protein
VGDDQRNQVLLNDLGHPNSKASILGWVLLNDLPILEQSCVLQPSNPAAADLHPVILHCFLLIFCNCLAFPNYLARLKLNLNITLAPCQFEITAFLPVILIDDVTCLKDVCRSP